MVKVQPKDNDQLLIIDLIANSFSSITIPKLTEINNCSPAIVSNDNEILKKTKK